MESKKSVYKEKFDERILTSFEVTYVTLPAFDFIEQCISTSDHQSLCK